MGSAKDLLIYDDSRDDSSKRVLARWPDIKVVDRASRRKFANALASVTGLDPAAVARTLVGAESENTVGANRNAALLDLQGRKFVAVDDDVIGQSFGPTDCGSPTFHSLCPWRYRLFANREAARAAVGSPRDGHFVADHMDFLGRQLLLAQRSAGTTSAVVPHRIAITANGSAGDSGWGGFPLAWLANQPGALDEVTPAQALNRALVRDVERPTATRDPWCQTMSLGYDATGFLPPFLPIGRAQDEAFGITLRACDPSALTLYLPAVVLHEPPPRQLSECDLWQSSRQLNLVQAHGLLLDTWVKQRTASSPSENLVALGGWLQELSRRADDLYELLEARLREIRQVREQDWTSSIDHLPKAWLPVLERYRAHRHGLDLNTLLGSHRELAPALGATGWLYRHWPTLLDASKALRQESPSES